jgi:hypothetical protein
MNEFINSIIRETTTSSDISYLPGGFTTMAGYMQTLSRMKPRWNVKVLEETDNYRVMFEEHMNVIVPKTSWDEFTDKVLKLKSPAKADLTVDLGSYLKEAKAQDLGKTVKELDHALMKVVAEPPILESDINMARWSEIFGVEKYITADVLLRYEQLENDIQKLTLKLKEEYAVAVGHLQMIVDALEDKTPLSSYDVFSSYDYLTGSIARSNFGGVILVFQTFVDLNFDRSEKIQILNAPEVMDELSTLKNVKVVKNEVYPIGEGFQTSLFSKLEDIIKGVKL